MNAWLIMKTERGRERPFLLQHGRATIGRSDRCDIRIALPTVAGQHCEIEFDGSEIKLRNLSTDQPARVNGKRVGEVDLKTDDQLSIGPVEFVVRYGRDAQDERSEAQESLPIGAASPESGPLQPPPNPNLNSKPQSPSAHATSARTDAHDPAARVGFRVDSPPRPAAG